MTEGVRFQSPSEWPKATRGWDMGRGVPIGGGIWGGGCASSPEIFLAEINAFW